MAERRCCAPSLTACTNERPRSWNGAAPGDDACVRHTIRFAGRSPADAFIKDRCETTLPLVSLLSCFARFY